MFEAWLKCKRNFRRQSHTCVCACLLVCVCGDFQRALNTFANIHFRAAILKPFGEHTEPATVPTSTIKREIDIAKRIKPLPPPPPPPWHLPCENILEVFTFRGHTYHT